MADFFISLPAWPFAAALVVAVLAVVTVWMCEASPVREDFDGGNDEWLRRVKR
jgi:ABC-type spermidine/putrescine transport system permease subunit I